MTTPLPWRQAQLLQSQWRTQEQLNAHQCGKLASVIRHAYDHVPYYRGIMDARELIQQVFGTGPVDFYGSMECGWIASQCSLKKGYHVNAECLIVELIHDGRPARPGERGEVVVTNLQARAMPFIRYSVGDVAVAADQPCSCRRGLPLIDAVEGSKFRVVSNTWHRAPADDMRRSPP